MVTLPTMTSFKFPSFKKSKILIIETPEETFINAADFAVEEERSATKTEASSDLKISLEFQCSTVLGNDDSVGCKVSTEGSHRSFSSFSGAAISANTTLSNTGIILKADSNHFMNVIDSPRLFIPSAPENGVFPLKGKQVAAGGPAGEDRLQVFFSEDDGWLYCGVYDGFNGRDAADFVAAKLHKKIAESLKFLQFSSFIKVGDRTADSYSERIQTSVKECLRTAISQTEAEFLKVVEEEMKEKQELAMAGCCLVSVLVHGSDLYTVNLGDSRAVLATKEAGIGDSDSEENLRAIQLTHDHCVDDSRERLRLEMEHPWEEAISNNRVKGKLKVTRAFGAGFLKHAKFNDALLGIFRVKGFRAPSYISSENYTTARKIQPEDRFVVVGSDGLFDFFSNEELVTSVSNFMRQNPGGDPSRFLVDEVVVRAAKKAEISVEKLKAIPYGERRKFHDDVTVAVINLNGGVKTTATASI